MKKTEEIKIETGVISIVFLEKAMAVYRKGEKLCELSQSDAKDLMNCFFDMINRVNTQEAQKTLIKGKRKPKTSKHI